MTQLVYGPLTLPTGKVIKFRKPTGLDKMNVLNTLHISQDDAVKAGILLTTYMQEKIVTEVDGTPTEANYKNLFNDWDDIDIQYYQTIYNEMFNLTEDKMEEAKEKAAFLLKSSTSTDGSNSQSNVTVE